MKKFLAAIVFAFMFCGVSFSQYYDTSAMRLIDLNRTASEGDLYLDTVNNVYRVGLTNGKLGYVSQTNFIDSLSVENDSILVLHYFDGTKDTADISLLINNSWKITGNDNIDDSREYLGTNSLADLVFKTNANEAMRINDTGDIQLAQYPENRADDTSTYLNLLYTDNQGYVKSARREIVPPTAFINATIVSSGNSFNYYTYYATQVTTVGLQPVPLANLDFYVVSFDPAVFNNVSISPTGVLTYDVIATSDAKTFIDVRFYTK